MADFCWDCCDLHLGVEGKLNDMRGLCKEDEYVRVLCEGCGEITVNSEGQRANKFTRMPELSDEMIEWLGSQARGKIPVWEPLLKYNFMLEFGHKHSGVPDSLPIEVAAKLVDEWLEKKQ